MPGNRGFRSGHAAGRAGSAVPGRSEAARPAGGMPAAGAADGWFFRMGGASLPLKPGERSVRNVRPRQRVLPAARPPFSSQWSVASSQRRPMYFTAWPAIAVELVNGQGVVSVRVDVGVIIVAVDVGPGRPGRSPAGGPSGAGGAARRRRRPRRSRSPTRVAGRRPALRLARPAGGPSRAGPGRRGGAAGGPRRPDRRRGRAGCDGPLGWAGAARPGRAGGEGVWLRASPFSRCHRSGHLRLQSLWIGCILVFGSMLRRRIKRSGDVPRIGSPPDIGTVPRGFSLEVGPWHVNMRVNSR